MRRYIALLAVYGWACALVLACGSNSDSGATGFASSGTGGSGGDSGPSSGSSSGTSGSSSGSSSGSLSGSSGSGFGSSDAASLGSGTCQAGLYSGTFSCLFYSGLEAGIGPVPDSGGVGPINGTLSFTLTQNISSTGELTQTDTASGTFLAATGGFISADADLSGTLDCASGKFVGQLLNGAYGLSFTGGAPAPDPNNKFQGPFDSDYNGKTSAFVNGRWSMQIQGNGYYGACAGPWTATYAGPGDGGPSDAGGQ